jgi:serine/threonine-protein kinase RIO1
MQQRAAEHHHSGPHTAWCSQEMRNLKRIEASGIKCPEALMLRSHVLLMRFLGKVRLLKPILHRNAQHDSRLLILCVRMAVLLIVCVRMVMLLRDSRTHPSVQINMASATTN